MTTEYVVLVGGVGLALMFALVAVGPRLVSDYQSVRKIVASPLP